MTVIVAVSDGTRVCVAADSAGQNNGTSLPLSDPKIMQVGPVILGSSGMVINDIVRSIPPWLTPRRYQGGWCWGHGTGMDGTILRLRPWLVDLMPWMRERIDSLGLLCKGDATDKVMPNTFIAALGDSIVYVDVGGTAMEPSLPYWATGSGRDHALGSLHTAHHEEAPSPEIVQAATRAVAAAIAFDPACGGPIVFKVTDA